MRQVEKWKWGIRWAGRWTTTHIPRAEEDIKREHQEAIKISGTRTVIVTPESAR